MLHLNKWSSLTYRNGLRSFASKPSASFGYVYDKRMLEHDCKYDSSIQEDPKRMSLIHERLQKDGALKNAVKIEAREATDKEIMTTHPESLIRELESLDTNEKCEDYCRDKELIYTNPKSHVAAKLAAGSSIEIVKAAVEGRIHNGFAIVRPPSHHSYGKLPQGYCLFNNTAIAARYAADELGLERIAVVDFDYHAGNGTYYSLKGDKRFHMTSIHAYHHGAYWPFKKDFSYETDENTLFVPLNGTLNTEGDYLSIFHHLLLPILRQYKPQLILISAGMDAGYYDYMKDFGQAVKAPGYGHMARLLDEICPGKVVALLEGGYFPTNYVEGASMVVRGLKGLDLPKVDLPKRLNGALLETILANLYHHKEKYPELRKTVEKFEAQQKRLGLEPFPHRNKNLFLGAGLRRLFDVHTKNKIAKTRNWLPAFTEDQIKLANEKINEYISKYEYSSTIDVPTSEQLISQLVWDDKSDAENYTRSAPFTSALVNEFYDFVEGRTDSYLVCDQELYREKIKEGKIDPSKIKSGINQD